MKYKNIYVLLFAFGAFNLHPAEQQDLPQEMVTEIFKPLFNSMKNQTYAEALQTITKLRATKKSFAGNQQLKNIGNFIKDLETQRREHNYLSNIINEENLIIIAALLHDIQWLKNNTTSQQVKNAIEAIIKQIWPSLANVSLSILEALWPLIPDPERKMTGFFLYGLVMNYYIFMNVNEKLAHDFVIFLKSKNISLNDSRGYSVDLQTLLISLAETIKSKQRGLQSAALEEHIRRVKKFYEILKSEGAKLNPSYMQKAKELELE